MILVSSWEDGVFVIEGDRVTHELAGRSVASLARDPAGRALAIVDGAAIYRREATWTRVVEAPDLACCVATDEAIYVGTNTADVLRVDAQSAAPLAGFHQVAGRERWYAGTAVVDGRVVGPPLGVRSLAATCDGQVLLANVHVGGIPRSTDGGERWEPTLDLELDAHEVCAHPSDPRCVIAATGAGLCISRDAGRSWTLERRGLHALHCAAVGFVGDDLWISCASEQFAPDGAVYRRPIASDEPLVRVPGLLPWTDGIVDTRGISALGRTAALVDRSQLYISDDAGQRWSRQRFPAPSGVLVMA